ncbi:MAG: Metal-dependent hydrolase [Hyphomicrobiales bacterium]|nr:Metal-dependent hydrolase [Hyphomicrobiales bacterium]
MAQCIENQLDSFSMLRLFRRETSSGTSAQDHLDIAHEGAVYRVSLRRVTGARRYTLRVRNATRDVVITMPKRGSLTAAQDFAQRHAAWIAARLHRLPVAVPFRAGAIIPVRGLDHEIVHRNELRGRIELAVSETGARKLIVSCDEDHLSRRVHDFLKREARTDLESAVRKHTGSLGFSARRITVRDTTSRWGSCSATGALNFSWRLIMSPEFVLDYLAAHEVAHLVHMNHSDAFWTVTRTLAPHTERAEAWLHAHGASLHRFGVEPDQSVLVKVR